MRSSDWSSDVCSSDLIASGEAAWQSRGPVNRPGLLRFARNDAESGFLTIGPDDVRPPPRHHPSSHRLHQPDRRPRLRRADRSEEHTSELQSLMRISSAVFCVKKKNNSAKKINRN